MIYDDYEDQETAPFNAGSDPSGPAGNRIRSERSRRGDHARLAVARAKRTDLGNAWMFKNDDYVHGVHGE